MKTLHHNQTVRVAGKSGDLRVLTFPGCVADLGVESLEAARERANHRHYDTHPSVSLEAAVLTGNHPGKADEFAKREAIRNAAPLIEDGGTYEIEGVLYMARIIARHVSDPVHFAPVPALDDANPY